MKNTNAMLLKILFAVEMILSIRILLFTVPVYVSRWGGEKSMGSDSPWIALLTLTAALYCVTGLVSLVKESAGRILHVVSIVVIAGYYFLKVKAEIPSEQTLSTVMMAVALVGVTLAAFLLKSESKVSA